MKKIILLALFVLSINSCNKDDDDECTCNAKYLTGNGQFFVPKQPIDCDTRQPKKLHPSGFFAGCTD